MTEVPENIVIGACNLLDTIKSEWGSQWSDWDQSIRDGLSKALSPAPASDVADVVRRLNETLGGIECPAVMHGDNLSIILCGAFDDNGPEVDEYGWSEAAITGCNATLKAIQEHYAPAATLIETLSKQVGEARKVVLEEAAKRVENYREIDAIAHDIKVGNFPRKADLAVKFAAAIRALIPEAKAGETE